MRSALDRSSGHDRGHRLGSLPVVPVGIALPHSDDVGESIVTQLDDHRRDALVRGVVRPRDAERVAQAEVQDLVADGQAHPFGDPRQGIDGLADLRPEPLRAEPERVVGRQPGLGRGRRDDRSRLVIVGIERRVECDGDDLGRRDESGDLFVQGDEPGEACDRERRLGQVVEIVFGETGLVDHDHRLRRGAMDERQRHR